MPQDGEMSWLGQRPFSLKSALVMRSTATCRPNSEFGARSSAQVCKTRNDEPRRTVLRAVRGISCVSAGIKRSSRRPPANSTLPIRQRKPSCRWQFPGSVPGRPLERMKYNSRSRGALFLRTRAMCKPFPKTTPYSPRQSFGRGWTEGIMIGTAHEQTNGNWTRKQNADRSSPQPLALLDSDRAAPERRYRAS